MRGQVRKTEYELDLATKFGIFASSLLVTSAAVWFYSPVISSHADDNVTTEIQAVINPVASVTLDTNNLAFSVVPTSAGVFSSQPITATVQTNSTGGYELYFSATDDNTAMTHSDSSITDTIPSNFEGTVTSSTMSVNTWGYSLDDTDFLKIPTSTNSTKIKDIDHFPETSEKSTPVYIGTKISSDLASGTYSKDVIFTVVAHETPEPVPTMQNFDKTTLVNVGDSAQLQDTRDGNMYTVKKLADDNVWMTENLRIINKTITSEDSDVSTDYTIPASNNQGFKDYDYYFPSDIYRDWAYLIDDYSGYYSYHVAAAGTVEYGGGSGTASGSICPKGWRLPTGGYGNDSDFKKLYNLYNSLESLQGEPAFELAGYMFENNIRNRNKDAHYWASTFEGEQQAHAFRLYTSTSNVQIYPSDGVTKSLGNTIRCIAR